MFRVFRLLALLGALGGIASFVLVSSEGKSPLADALFNVGFIFCAVGVLGGAIWIVRAKLLSRKAIEDVYKKD
jgi:hypothetical protein